MVRYSLFKSESIEVEVFNGDKDNYVTKSYKENEKDVDTWVSHSSSDIPSDLGEICHSRSGREEWSSEQSDAFDGVSEDGVASIATVEDEDVNAMVDAIANCNVDIAWDLEVQGDDVVCVEEEIDNTTNSREEEELDNEMDLAAEVENQAFDCVVGEEENTNFKDGSGKDVKEESINEESKIKLSDGDEIAKDECDVEIDNNEEYKKNDVHINDKTAGKIEATPDKVATMMRDRISAINNIRGLLEVTENKEDIVLKITNKVKVLKHDLECKEQANKEILETLTYLKTKNEDYARQLTQLSSTVDQLVNNKHESIKRMDEMKDELAAKKTIIDELIVEFDNQSTLLEEQKAENVDLTEQLQYAITKNDGLESEVQTLDATTKILENHLNEKKNTIEKLSADLNILCTGCEEMSDDIDIKNQLLNEKVADNVNLAEQLRLAKSEISELKTAIQTLFMAVGTKHTSKEG